VLGILVYNGDMKKRLNFPDQINILCGAETRNTLVAIAFHRGEGGRYADPARDFVADGIRRYIEGLKGAERTRFDEILSTVRTSDAYKKQIRHSL
jgi:hypothetical protein